MNKRHYTQPIITIVSVGAENALMEGWWDVLGASGTEPVKGPIDPISKW